jgi:hypothetical protein
MDLGGIPTASNMKFSEGFKKLDLTKGALSGAGVRSGQAIPEFKGGKDTYRLFPAIAMDAAAQGSLGSAKPPAPQSARGLR